ncbi:MAG TPA: polysaccharide biosynthesis C-terminal domain-containing protein [Phycisphaerae bacterium]|nr:polysaccharide biosynthesis C-terminal domain-containing protein [Phycisphaerae bacterium]
MTFGSRIAILILGLASQSCMAWFLAPAGRGSYAVCLLFTTMLTLICLFGCDVAALYFVASRRSTLSEGIMNTLLYGGSGCLLAIVAGLVVMQMPLAFLTKASVSAFHLSLVLIPIGFFSSTLVLMLNSLSEFVWLAVFTVGGSLTHLVFTVLFVPLLGWGVEGAMVATNVSGLITIAAVLVLFRRRHGLRPVRPSWPSVVDMFHYGVKYYVGKISNNVNFQVGAIILAFFASKEEIGLFTLATMLTAQIMMIPDTLTTVLIPRVATDKHGRRDLIAQCARVTLILCGLGLLGLCMFARPIVGILFSEAFLPMVSLVWISSLGILVRSATKVMVPFMLNTNHPGITSISTAIGMVTNVILLWLLMPRWGLDGAAWAMTFGYLTGAAVLLAGFVRISGLRHREIWRFRWTDWTSFVEVWHGVRGRMGAGLGGAN